MTKEKETHLKIIQLQKVISEASDLIKKANYLLKRYASDNSCIYGCSETGSVKRQMLDLKVEMSKYMKTGTWLTKIDVNDSK